MNLFVRCAAVALLLTSTALAQAPCYAENDGPNFDDFTSMGGPWVAIKFVAPSGFIANRLEVFTGELTGMNTCAIYSHDATGDQPASQLTSVVWNNVSTLNAWQGGVVSAQVALSQGTTYWFVWIPVGGAQASTDAMVPGLSQIYRASFDNGMTWAGPFQDMTNHWKFRIFGTCSLQPVPYCTSSTSTNGCLAVVLAAQNPSVTFANACPIVVANVEGQKSGIIFYGLQATATPWCSQGGGTSMLCVKAPTKRTGVQNSGGAINNCNGSFALDWNAFQQANPGALGAPWAAGDKVYVQGWFRDPPSCKTTNLSNAVELTYQP
jgi:hypothetical protein